MSPAANSATGRLKVTVTWIGDALVGSGAIDDRVTVGATESRVRLKPGAAPFTFPARSCATPAPMAAVTRPSPDGVRLKVYTAPLPAKPPTVAFVAVMSPAA